VFGLVIGVGIGLYFGDRVVLFIQGPLTEALTDHYNNKTIAQFDAFAREMGGTYEPISEDEKKRLLASWRAAGLIPEFLRINPRTLVMGGSTSPTALSEMLDPGDPNQQQVLILWRKMSDDRRVSTTSLSAQEAFLIWLKAGFVTGLLLSSWWVFYQLWLFVAAGLYPHEKKYVYIFLPFSIGLFLAGAAMAFFLVFDYVLPFLFEFNRWMGIEPDARISEWLSFVLFLPLGFGIAFQLPLVMLFMERIGIFTAQAYIEKWRISVLVIAVMSMMLTPADPMSMILMFVPLVALFFLGIGLCKYWRRGEAPKA
jgi:sec-independent protein translocase protein TatC